MHGRPPILILFALVVATCGGCTNWHPPKWDLDGLRDPRALAVERRLDERSSMAKDDPPPKATDDQ